jgi:hypothetical protein
MSMRPWASSAAAATASQSCSLVTSCASEMAGPSSSRASCRARAPSASVSSSEAPSAANRLAVAVPMPPAAPVMMASFPSSRAVEGAVEPVALIARHPLGHSPASTAVPAPR